ncbi:MAG: hypothetical protein U5R46_05640 [Gammaproteobacteria bacterium]|nr:hypothetical protein [Gammaproteobacteria bacterium]
MPQVEPGCRKGRCLRGAMRDRLDGATGPQTEAHIFTADKGDYHSLDDDIPCFAAGG